MSDELRKHTQELLAYLLGYVDVYHIKLEDTPWGQVKKELEDRLGYTHGKDNNKDDK